jgi:uncharacterized glyoxalase superfamily protein PhnB
MKTNRSMLNPIVIPELAYQDVNKAADWLVANFGFKKRLVIGDHRVQIEIGNGGAIVAIQGDGVGTATTHAVMVRVEDADELYDRLVRSGVNVLGAPTSYPFGERQFSAEDVGGHRWTFSQTIDDVDPASWGGELVNER